MPNTKPGVFTLYRFWNYRQLLYVGRTTNPPARLKQHKQSKGWWESITHITLEHFGNDAALHKAESIAILSEQPMHNIEMPNWKIDSARAKETFVFVRERWGICNDEEYKQSLQADLDALRKKIVLLDMQNEELQKALELRAKLTDISFLQLQKVNLKDYVKFAEAQL